MHAVTVSCLCLFSLALCRPFPQPLDWEGLVALGDGDAPFQQPWSAENTPCAPPATALGLVITLYAMQ